MGVVVVGLSLSVLWLKPLCSCACCVVGWSGRVCWFLVFPGAGGGPLWACVPCIGEGFGLMWSCKFVVVHHCCVVGGCGGWLCDGVLCLYSFWLVFWAGVCWWVVVFVGLLGVMCSGECGL